MRKTQATLRVLLNCCKEASVAFAFFYFTAFLFGAPLWSNRTAVFAVDHLFLTYLPLSSVCRRDLTQFWYCVDNHPRTLDQLYVSRAAFGSLLGAWLGAVVVPLDWDCWWQVWPLCSHFGSLFGVLLGALSAYFRIYTNAPFVRPSKRKSSIAPYLSEPLVQLRHHQNLLQRRRSRQQC